MGDPGAPRARHLRLVPRPRRAGGSRPAWLNALRAQVRAHPARTLALTIGVGWLLGRVLRRD